MNKNVELILICLVGAAVGWASNYFINSNALWMGYILGMLVGTLLFLPALISHTKFINKLDRMLQEMADRNKLYTVQLEKAERILNEDN